MKRIVVLLALLVTTAGVAVALSRDPDPSLPSALPSSTMAVTTTLAVTSTTADARAFELSVDPALRSAARRAVAVVPEIRRWTDSWVVEISDLSDKEQGDSSEAVTVVGSSCSTYVNVARVDVTARVEGFDRDEYLASVLAHEAAHCEDKYTERLSIKAEALFASRTHNRDLAQLARCEARHLDSTGNWKPGPVRCEF